MIRWSYVPGANVGEAAARCIDAVTNDYVNRRSKEGRPSVNNAVPRHQVIVAAKSESKARTKTVKSKSPTQHQPGGGAVASAAATALCEDLVANMYARLSLQPSHHQHSAMHHEKQHHRLLYQRQEHAKVNMPAAQVQPQSQKAISKKSKKSLKKKVKDVGTAARSSDQHLLPPRPALPPLPTTKYFFPPLPVQHSTDTSASFQPAFPTRPTHFEAVEHASPSNAQPHARPPVPIVLLGPSHSVEGVNRTQAEAVCAVQGAAQPQVGMRAQQGQHLDNYGRTTTTTSEQSPGQPYVAYLHVPTQLVGCKLSKERDQVQPSTQDKIEGAHVRIGQRDSAVYSLHQEFSFSAAAPGHVPNDGPQDLGDNRFAADAATGTVEIPTAIQAPQGLPTDQTSQHKGTTALHSGQQHGSPGTTAMQQESYETSQSCTLSSVSQVGHVGNPHHTTGSNGVASNMSNTDSTSVPSLVSELRAVLGDDDECLAILLGQRQQQHGVSSQAAGARHAPGAGGYLGSDSDDSSSDGEWCWEKEMAALGIPWPLPTTSPTQGHHE